MRIRGPRSTFDMSDRDHHEFKNLVMLKLRDIYGQESFSTMSGVWGNFLNPLEGLENPNRVKSILNYLNTNILFRELICRKSPSISSYQELKEYFSKNYRKFMDRGGEYFLEVVQLLEKTEEIGILNELSAIPRLKRGLKEKLSLDVNVVYTLPDSEDDLIGGIDLYYLDGEKKVGCQVKPLRSFSVEGDTIIIESSGLIKKYPGIQFLIFIDRHERELPREEKYLAATKFFIFYNDPISIENKTLIFSQGSLFYTNQIG
jgi:hypothetical protein